MPRKKRLSEMARKYQDAYNELYDKLPLWKKEAIGQGDLRMTNELAKNVAQRAEQKAYCEANEDSLASSKTESTNETEGKEDWDFSEDWPNI